MRLGAAERDFIHTASINFLTPLLNFLEGDWKTISVRSLGLHASWGPWLPSPQSRRNPAPGPRILRGSLDVALVDRVAWSV